jgi:autophagy-related protein 9
VALVNKDLLPVHLPLPGASCEVVFLSQGLKYNMEWLLFKGPWAPFDKWHLKDDYKRINKRKELVENLQSRIAMLAALNFLLMPLVLLWQILYCFYNYAEMVTHPISCYTIDGFWFCDLAFWLNILLT